MSINGLPYTWLRASLQRGDLAGVRCAALELRQVNLADALAIVLLMSAKQDPAYQRAAIRWLTRLVSERPNIGLQDLRIALDALQSLADTQPGRTALAELCARHHVGDVIGLPATDAGPPAQGDPQRGRARP